MNYWLLKTEPDTYSWDDLVAKKRDMWDGVRNYAARKNLLSMAKGDIALIYHSGKKPEIVGLATIVREAYPDPTAAADEKWVVVDVEAGKALEQRVALKTVKDTPELKKMVLVNISRLSVQPVTEYEFKRIMQLSGAK